MNDQSFESSLAASPFKPLRDEQPTRHPTTVKKEEHSPQSRFHMRQSNVRASESRRPHSYSLRESILCLKNQKDQCLRSGRYSLAGAIDGRIKRSQSMLNRAEIKYIKEAHKSQKKSIRRAHKQELLQFQHAWESYFRRLRGFQKAKLEQFREQQDQEIEFIREKLRKKCSTLRHPSKKVIDLDKEEEYHISRGNIAELVLIRREKKRLVDQYLMQMGSVRLERTELVGKWTQLEGQQLERLQERKYDTLMGRLEEQQRDEKAELTEERRRLKQKYKNVLVQLKHQQRMTLNFISKRQKTL